MEYRITTAPGTEHEHTFETADLWFMTIHKPLITGNIGVGFCPTSYIVAKLSLGDAIIPRTAEVQVWGRDTPDAEWRPLGTYWVGKRTKSEHGQLEITAYNAMRKAQQNYAAITRITTWPAPMADVVADIAAILGVTVDPRTAIKTGADYVVSNPLLEYPYASSGTLTMHEVLSWIAAAHGGSFVVTDVNALYLVPLAPAADAVAQDIGSNCRKLSLVADPLTISRVTVWTGSETHYTAGDDVGYNLELDCPYATQTICDDLLVQLGGYTYIPFEAERAAVGIATQPGDPVRIKDMTYYVGGMDVSCGARFLADLRAPATVETDDEFPVKSAEERNLERVKASVSQQVGTLDKTLNQEGIFKRLTNNGEWQGLYTGEDGNIYINATYIRSGEFLADLIKAGVIRSVDGITLRIDLDTGEITSCDPDNALVTARFSSGRIILAEYDPQEFAAVSLSIDGLDVHRYEQQDNGHFYPHEFLVSACGGSWGAHGESYIKGTTDEKIGAEAEVELGTNAGDPLKVHAGKRNYISGLSAPVDDTDAANKAYVDSATENLGFFTMSVDDDGNLWANYGNGTAPTFELDADGNIYFVTEE